MVHLFKIISVFFVAILTIANFTDLNSKQKSPVPVRSTTIERLADMNHYLDGVNSTIANINSLGETAVPYCIVTDETSTDNENAYWFTNYESLALWLEGKPFKDSLIRDIQIMDSLSNDQADESLKSRHNSNALWGLNYANAWQNSNGTGTSNAYFYWHKTLHSFNNQASKVQMNAPGVVASCAFCTQTKFKGSKLFIFALFVNTKDLSGTFYNDNFESVY